MNERDASLSLSLSLVSCFLLSVMSRILRRNRKKLGSKPEHGDKSHNRNAQHTVGVARA